MPDDIDIFPLLYHGAPFRHDLYVIHRSDKYISSYLARFIELIENYFRVAEVTPVGPCARQESLTTC